MYTPTSVSAPKVQPKKYILIMPQYSNGIPRNHLNIILSRWLSNLDNKNLVTEDIVFTMIGLVVILCKDKSYSSSGIIADVASSAGIKLNVIKGDLASMEAMPDMFCQYEQYAEKFNGYLDRCEHSWLFVALACSTLMLMMKSAQGEGPYHWYMRRNFDRLGATLDEADLGEYINQLHYVSESTADRIGSAMRANFGVRKNLFLTLKAVDLSVEGGTPIERAIRELVDMMKYTEMKHLLLMEKYLIDDYPEVQQMFALRGFIKTYRNAVQQLKGLYRNKSEYPYIKILYDRSRTSLSDWQHFELYTLVAATIAQMVDPSFKGYKFRTNDSITKILESVRRFMTEHIDGMPGATVSRPLAKGQRLL